MCQKFRILEDQTVAHILQEQEIHQHLAANELKNQQVRKNLQVARKLQEEEDEQSRRLVRRLHKQIEDMESGYTQMIQEELDRQEDDRHRQLTYREASRLKSFVRGMERRHEEEERKELETEESDEVPVGQGIRYSQPRSRKPYVGRETEEGAKWCEGGYETRREGGRDCDSNGSKLGEGEAVANGSDKVIKQLGRYQSPVYHSCCVKQTHVMRETSKEGLPHNSRTRSKGHLERPRTRPSYTEETQRAASAKERDDWKRECRSDWSYTEGSEYQVSPGDTCRTKPTIAGSSHRHVQVRADSSRPPPNSHSVFTNGKDLDISHRSVSDSESHPRHRKHKHDTVGIRSHPRSQDSQRPIQIKQNSKGLSNQNSEYVNHPETVRHKGRSQGDHRPLGELAADSHSQLVIKQRAKHLHYPWSPKERLRQQGDQQKEQNGHRPLAVKEQEKQAHRLLAVNEKHVHHPLVVGEKQAHRLLAGNETPVHHPLVVGEKQAHRLLAVNEKHVHHPLVVGEKQAHRPLAVNEKPVHHPLIVGEKQAHRLLAVNEKPVHPLRPKVKEKQVTFLLGPEEREKSAHSPLAIKEKQVQYPLDLKGKQIHSPLAVKQKRVHFPLAVEKKGKDVQNSLFVKEKEVQYPLAIKEKINPAHFPLAVKRNPIQYRLGSKDTEAIIDYLSDKQKENDSSSPKQVNKSTPASRENGYPEKDRDKPAENTFDKTRLLLSQPAGDIQENHAQPMRLQAEKASARNHSSNRSKASSGHARGSRWRDERSQRATNGPKAVDEGWGQSSHRREAHRLRSPVNNIRDRSGRSKSDRSQTPSPLNRQEKTPRSGSGPETVEQRVSEIRTDSPKGRSRIARNGATVPSWCNDETLIGLQEVELRKAQLRKTKADEKLAQLAQDEEFAMNLLRKEVTALSVSKGRKQPARSHAGQDSPDRGNERSPRSCSPRSVNVDSAEQTQVPKSAYF
ncbi:uncharacterized protein [Heptranchias perlo]|uniref:uncharacterized protein isoform X2 n=1 Tax=Heptranchias perlo TaxID=212740 RepID=UPI0035597204